MNEDILISRVGSRAVDGSIALWQLDAPEPAGPVVKDLQAAGFTRPILALVHTPK
jgi:hypothetical protein